MCEPGLMPMYWARSRNSGEVAHRSQYRCSFQAERCICPATWGSVTGFIPIQNKIGSRQTPTRKTRLVNRNVKLYNNFRSLGQVTQPFCNYVLFSLSWAFSTPVTSKVKFRNLLLQMMVPPLQFCSWHVGHEVELHCRLELSEPKQ